MNSLRRSEQIAYEKLLRTAGVVCSDYKLSGSLKIPADEQVSVESDIQLMAMRLTGTNSNIFDSYDRLISEAEFRRSVALP